MSEKQRGPDLIVYAKSLTDDQYWRRIGVAWVNEKKGVLNIRVSLDFMPNDGQLSMWPADTDPPASKKEEP